MHIKVQALLCLLCSLRTVFFKMKVSDQQNDPGVKGQGRILLKAVFGSTVAQW